MTNFSFSIVDNSGFIDQKEFEEKLEINLPALQKALEGEEKYSDALDWHDISLWAGEEWLKKYEEIGNRINKDCDALVVIGIGGSNQAARAVYEALGKKNNV